MQQKVIYKKFLNPQASLWPGDHMSVFQFISARVRKEQVVNKYKIKNGKKYQF
jgi:hypothetical protein